MKKVRDLINGPIGGLAPWIAMSLLAGTGRYELAVGVAFAISIVVVTVGRAGGGSWKILELSDITFFTLVAILGLVLDACSTPVGIALIVIGVAASRALDQHRKGAAAPPATEPA